MKLKKIYKSTTFGLAMVLATIGLKLDIQPLGSASNGIHRRPSQSVVISSGQRHGVLNLPTHQHTVSTFTLTTIASNPRFFIVTPSKAIYKLLKHIISSILTPSSNTANTEAVNEGDLLNLDEAFTFDSQQVDLVTSDPIDHLENTRLIQSAIKLNNKRFVKNLKILLDSNKSNLDVEKVLVLIKQALTVDTHSDAEQILTDQVHDNLESYLVLCKDQSMNLFRRFAQNER